MASQADYEKAMANRYATTRVGTGRNDYGYTGIPSNQARGYRPTKKKTGGGFPLGGLMGGRKSYAGFSEDDLKRQLEYDKAIWERSTPDVTGVGGTVRWDRDKNMVTAALSPENQAIYDAMIGRREMFGGQVDDLAGGGWQDAQQQRFDQMRAMYRDSDALERQERLAREQATGASSTGRYWGERAEGDVRDQRNLGLMNTAFLQSQALIDSGIERELGAVTTMGTLGDRANAMIKMPTPDTQGNMPNVSTASTRWADALAMDALKKQQGKSKFWDSILGGQSGGMFGGSGGGGFPSYIATATTQAIGEDGLSVFNNWRDYMSSWHPTFTTSFGRYRVTAPKIVAEIDKKDNSKALYKEIWDNYLKPIFDLIKKDKDDPKALSDYKIMVRELKNKYLV